ncbi:MAG: helix-turn-helix transcriptional regulator [Bacteroidota bacterium]
MDHIKTYQNVNRQNPRQHFGISRMEDIYARREGVVDSPHRHDYYTVLLVKRARGAHFIDFREYPLRGRQVFFIAPGQVHQVVEEEASVGYSLVFSRAFLAENNIPFRFLDDLNLFRDYGDSPPMDLEAERLRQLSYYCEEMLVDYHSQDRFRHQAAAALLEIFLIRANNWCTLPFGDPHGLEAGNLILREFKKLVEKRFGQWHQSQQYAEALHITPDHLNRTVKSLIGKTAKEYLQSRLVIAAQRLLYFSEQNNKEIAYELGFSEPANFSAFFKKHVGVSPSAFRKQRV